MSKPTRPTSIRQVYEAARNAGWRIEEGSRHTQCFAPDGVGRVTVSSTPSDFRAIRKIISNFRANGLELKS